jgi:hypothetical protein
MTIGKASALVVGFLGAVALGIAIGPSLTHRDSLEPPAASPSAAEAPQPASDAVEPRPAAKARVRAAELPTKEATRVSPSAPELGDRLKPVLNRGANMAMAAEGFRDAEQFATVAHAARNTKIPFMLLKHRVLNEGKSLAAAIKASNPDLNATQEVARARAQARGDLASIAG